MIYHLIYNVTKYYDWGTLEDWNKYKNEFKTLFIDIDGTLLEFKRTFYS